MKKINILLPTILVASSLPMVSMVGCNKNEAVGKVFVHFKTNGGSEIPDVEVEIGQPIEKPDDPTKPEYNFVGWYSDEELSIEYDFSTPVTAELTLYAKWEESFIHVTSVNILQETIQCWRNAEETIKVEYEILPDNATDKGVTWTVGDETIATVDPDGTIRPKKSGSTTIIIRTNDGGLIDECNLIVYTRAESISIVQGAKTNLYFGFEKQLTYKILPDDVTYTNVDWSSSDDEIVEIDGEGWLTPNKKGSATITASTTDGSELIAQCEVTVLDSSPLCFTAVEDGSTIGFNYDKTVLTNIHIQYSTELYGNDWQDWDGEPITLNNGDSIWVRNTAPSLSEQWNWFTFSMSGKIKASGNVNSMIAYDPLTDFCFNNLFNNCDSLVSAPDLPTTELEDYCYQGMFADCDSLTTAPELPATSLAAGCYLSMFAGCDSLTTAPVLIASSVYNSSYSNMFANCNSLTTAPDLPAKRLDDKCYSGMFANCSKLTTAPTILPADQAEWECYYYMFEGCTSLTTAPQLSATSVDTNSYGHMFHGCTALETPPELPAQVLYYNCYDSMFYDCTSLTTTPDLNGWWLFPLCYHSMFHGCTSLSIDKNWFVNNVFNKSIVNYGENWALDMFGGVYDGNEPYTLPDSSKFVLKSYCFSGLNADLNFSTVPSNYLPWNNLAQGCYSNMFKDCKNLTAVPNLPATTLAEECYYKMFDGCTSLKIKQQDTKTEDEGYIFTCPSEDDIPKKAVTDMFHGCACTEFEDTPNPGKSYYWYTE